MTGDLTTSPLAAAAELDAASPDLRSVVGWLSAHSAALERVVHPAARSLLGGASVDVPATRGVESALLHLHQLLSGDGRGGTALIPAAVSHLRTHLARHLTALTALEQQLQAALSPERWSELVGRYDDALTVAPTRPHPHAPHSGWTERLAFTVAASVDRLLDSLDSRVVARIPAKGSADALADLHAAAIG